MGRIASHSHFERYRQRVTALSSLTPAQEADLARRWRAGDRGAGTRLVEANLGFVLTIAREYRRWGAPMDDLVQQGNIGLLKAAERYDPNRDNRLRAYASYWIRAEIREYVVRGYRIVRLGTTRTERRAMRAYRAKHVETVEQLVEISGMPEARCRRLWPLLSQNDSYLDGPNGSSWLDHVAERSETPERQTIRREQQARQREDVAAALSSLSDREQKIVRARLMSDSPVTLEALSKRMGVSRERVRQLEQRAKQKLEGALAPLVA